MWHHIKRVLASAHGTTLGVPQASKSCAKEALALHMWHHSWCAFSFYQLCQASSALLTIPQIIYKVKHLPQASSPLPQANMTDA